MLAVLTGITLFAFIQYKDPDWQNEAEVELFNPGLMFSFFSGFGFVCERDCESAGSATKIFLYQVELNLMKMHDSGRSQMAVQQFLWFFF